MYRIGAVVLTIVALAVWFVLDSLHDLKAEQNRWMSSIVLTSTARAVSTPLPTGTLAYLPSFTPTPSETPEPTDTPVWLPSFTPTPEPTWTPEPPTDTPVPTETFTPVPTDTLVPTETFAPQPTDTPVPPPTSTPTPLPTATEVPPALVIDWQIVQDWDGVPISGQAAQVEVIFNGEDAPIFLSLDGDGHVRFVQAERPLIDKFGLVIVRPLGDNPCRLASYFPFKMRDSEPILLNPTTEHEVAWKEQRIIHVLGCDTDDGGDTEIIGMGCASANCKQMVLRALFAAPDDGISCGSSRRFAGETDGVYNRTVRIGRHALGTSQAGPGTAFGRGRWCSAHGDEYFVTDEGSIVWRTGTAKPTPTPVIREPGDQTAGGQCNDCQPIEPGGPPADGGCYDACGGSYNPPPAGDGHQGGGDECGECTGPIVPVDTPTPNAQPTSVF